jgi:hypothetical protein
MKWKMNAWREVMSICDLILTLLNWIQELFTRSCWGNMTLVVNISSVAVIRIKINFYPHSPYLQNNMSAMQYCRSPYNTVQQLWVSFKSMQCKPYFTLRGKSNFAHIFYIFIQLVLNLIQDMANKIYSLAVSYVKTCSVKTIFYSGS